jgi:hypothetical protein
MITCTSILNLSWLPTTTDTVAEAGGCDMDRRQFLTAALGATALPGAVGGAPATTAQSSYGPLGQVDLAGAKEAVLDESGTVAFCAVGDGFATVDVSDPASPTVLAERRGLLADRASGPMSGIYDVKYDADTLLVVGPANAGSPKAALFYDVSDPASPERIGVYDTGYPIHNSDFVDGTAYLTANTGQGNGLVMVDPNDGDPESVGSWSIASVESGWNRVNSAVWSLHDVFVQDGTAYIAHWDAGTWIVDVSDPGEPELVTKVRGRDPSRFADMGFQQIAFEQLQPPGNDHYVAVNDDASLLGVGMESWDADTDDDRGGPSGIDLYDISTPTDPQALATIDPPGSSNSTYGGVWTTSHNFEFRGDRLYTSWYQGGVRVFDVSDPADPIELAAWRDTDETSFWTARYATDGVFVAPSGEHPSKDLPHRLYTFPDPEDGARVQQPVTPTPNTTSTPTATTTAEATTAESTTAAATPTATDTDATDGTTTTAAGPGFGVLGTLAGIGLGAWRLRARAGDED